MTNDEKFLENITIGLIKIRHEVEKLDMENARLRKALEAIHEDDWVEGTKTHGPFIGQTLEEICRAALEGKE